MVVIEDLPQIRVAVRITGSDSDCVEYDDPDPPITPSVGGTAQHSVAKIIQSEDDAEFFVHYRIDNSLGCFTEGKDVEPPESFVTKYPDGNRLIARYVFRYKSGTILENEGIIQRDDLPETSVPPRLSPLHDNLTIDDLSQEKIRRLAQERLEDPNTVKREEKVKREGSPHPDMRPSKVYKVDSDGAIDLTDE
ncbi:hypothetical protein K4K60_000881 [Colletotrichum sp. SAR11_57]|nr:hypothetical protein K4K60_000881 [Colletotrichum sp. SAR11_57]